MKQSAFRAALAANRVNVSAAARHLGLNRSMLYRSMRGLRVGLALSDGSRLFLPVTDCAMAKSLHIRHLV
ncbi:hypothetical protein FTO74_07400 [Granulicella sp. WH15]|nr:hypothetical protein FTO74_07400 [Granulicella sp. WH15]